MTTSTTDDLTRHRELSALAYGAVWLALVVLATVTLFASRAVTGGWGLVVAFAIASAKAVLVVAYFTLQLRNSDGFRGPCWDALGIEKLTIGVFSTV